MITLSGIVGFVIGMYWRSHVYPWICAKVVQFERWFDKQIDKLK